MNLTDPRDAAIFACLVITFYSVSHLGEFTVPSMSKFAVSPFQYNQRQHLSPIWSKNNLPILSFHIPFMKCSTSGETTQCMMLNHLTDPVAWLQNHFMINNLGPNDHLFTWKHLKGKCPLTRNEVMKHIQEIVALHSLPNLKGHSLHIGGMLHYLLQGTPFNVIKTMGRWSGESFTRYLCKHMLILAPYLQERPQLVKRLTSYTMPPVC